MNGYEKRDRLLEILENREANEPNGPCVARYGARKIYRRPAELGVVFHTGAGVVAAASLAATWAAPPRGAHATRPSRAATREGGGPLTAIRARVSSARPSPSSAATSA